MMDEKTALTGTTTTTSTTKEKKGYTPLVVLFTCSITLLLVCLSFYPGQPMHGGTSLAGSGTTHTCVKSVGTYDSQKDYCYTCGSREKGTLGYCWNSQTPQCPPSCDNVQGVSGIGDNQCGDACDKFLYENGVLLASQ